MTTAQYRKQAQEAEKALAWVHAAALWDLAISTYPNPRGALAKADLAKMSARRDSALKMA